ncbi:MAG: putative oxidoreductase YjmC [Desulfovibrio sp.]
MAASTVYVPHGMLTRFTTDVLRNLGMPEADAAYAADCLVQTTLWGIDSHGIIRLLIYSERLGNGALKPAPHIRVLKEFGAMALMDGDACLGYIGARDAMKKAVTLAKTHGIGSVLMNNSNHFGAAGIYAREAAKEGMLALIMSNTPVNMAAPGSKGPVLGNHPIAFAAPLFDEHPMVFDTCMSEVAGGKLLVAKEKGEKIPFGWAVDKDGNPTDDPAAGLTGAFLPLAGHKGYCFALMEEVLTGPLSRGVFMGDIGHLFKQPTETCHISHHMLAINPLALMEKEEWTSSMRELRRRVKETPMREEGAELIFPGEIEDACDAKRRQEGIPMTATLFESLNKVGEPFGLSMSLGG